MYAKLAIRNIKRSFKDYTIYFFTLVFGVAIFYTFNSIESQTVMMDLSEAEKNAFSMVTIVMSIASVFISFILGFLIIYANNYLIKRRKKEFGIYMTLGMEKEKLSKILFIETLCIGVISLLVGTIIGIMVSQGLSIFTAKLFKVDITKFIFIFSKDAFLKTLICFSIIYLVVLLFNSNIIRRVKLVDLLTASKKNENIKSRNVWINIMIFTISVILLGTAYYFVLKVGIAIVSPILFGIVAIGALGTFLFFFSLSGFLLKVFKSNKTYYFKGLNMFVLKQISSKINTNFISMTFICLMLFISICTLSGGLGINKALNKDVKELFQFDASLWNYEGIDIKENVLNSGVDLDSISKNYSEYKLYYSEYAFGDFLSGKAMKENKNYYPIMTNANIPIVKVSEFNSIMKMLGKDEVTIKDNEYMLYSDIDDIEKYLVESLENNTEILINGHKLLPADKKTIEVVTYNQVMKNNLCTIIVNDDLLFGLSPVSSYLNINYDDSSDEEDLYEKLSRSNISNSLNIYYSTKIQSLANVAGEGTMISYLAIYMGIVFLIAAAAVLALQQLSETADNINRYALLKKIGADEKLINKAILMQTGIYFMVPLSLAIIHSIVGLKFSADIVSIIGDGSIMTYIIVTIILMVIVYGGYFMATYTGAKKLLKYR